MDALFPAFDKTLQKTLSISNIKQQYIASHVDDPPLAQFP